jgi:3-isopropylmalate/(R)-2-methylmalate dehydratase small subunit
VVVDSHTHKQLFRLLEQDNSLRFEVDLASQTLTLPDGKQVAFPIDPFSKKCLLNGVDEMGYLLNFEPEISRYESTRPPAVTTTQ